MSEKITPGPWHFHDNHRGAWSVKTDRDYDSGVMVASRGQWEHNAEESAANGRLIAAAPELLDEIYRLIEWAQSSSKILDIAPTKALINKIEGTR